MKIRGTIAATAIALCTLGVSAANASVVLSDNFDSDVPVILNWPGDATFRSIPGPGNVGGLPSVDLVSNANGFGYLAYNGATGGVSLDLDGSTGGGFSPAGEIQSIVSLGLGDYTVSFLLAGNLRGAPNQTVSVSIGGQTINVTPSSNSQPYTLYNLYFSGASGQVAFTDLGPSDQQGDLLDNIVVTTGVPEPATWIMLLTGFFGVGFMMRGSHRRRPIATA
jgi:hypothetical protein